MQLGNWVRRQRKLYNRIGRDGFPPDRLARLKAIGFDFDPVRSGTSMAKERAKMFRLLGDNIANPSRSDDDFSVCASSS